MGPAAAGWKVALAVPAVALAGGCDGRHEALVAKRASRGEKVRTQGAFERNWGG